MNYLASLGASRRKLLLGIPFYGQTFTLAKRDNNYGIGAASTGPGSPGEYTKQPGMLAYYEICNRVKNLRWSVNKGTTTYAYHRDQWIGYDDVESAEEKVRFLKLQLLKVSKVSRRPSLCEFLATEV